ncbi:MAG: cobalt transporter CbiM [Armatimonadota bacterium]
MHIPDSYLSPQTYLPAYAVTISLWAWASQKLKRSLRMRQVPQLALGAAFSFIIMMFNVPVPGGTTGHAVGAVLIAILLGPWAAMVAVSLTLIVQAVLFGDGGITAIGANCVNMAVVMPVVGYWVYRLCAFRAAPDAPRRWIAAAIGGYAGLNAAALTTAVMFGLQPLIAHDAAGRALYAPYPLQVAIPAMAISHLLLFGIVEAVVTGLAVAYFQRVKLDVPEFASTPRRPSRVPRLVWALLVLVLLTPLGIYLPAKFGAGPAWGEWSVEEVVKLVGYLPRGMANFQAWWHAPVPEYALPGQESAPFAVQSLTYIFSAALGVAVLFLVVFALRALFAGKDPEHPAGGSAGSAKNPEPSPPPADTARPRRRSIVRRTLDGIAGILAEMLTNESIAAGPGLLQTIDARAKVLGLVGLVVAATLVHHLPVLLVLYGISLLLATASAVPARRMARVWLTIPLFSAAMMLPAMLNIVTPGKPLWILGHFTGNIGPWPLPATLAVTDAGIFVASRFVLRVAVCVSLMLLLAVTTRPDRLFRGLRLLAIPKIFVTLLSMMQRYLSVLLRAAEEIHLAKISRTITPGPLRREQAWVAAGMGALFRRTQHLGNDVYLAMLSRGYTGEVYVLDESSWRWSDWVFLAGVLLVGVAAGLLG